MLVGIKAHTAVFKQLRTYVHENGLRPSRVREMVLEQVCLLPQPFTADQLVEACRAQRISVGTVYNALNLFLLAHILHANERQRGRSATEYELIIGKQMRMQMMCTKCGRVSEIRDKAIERLVKERKYTNFTMRYFSLFIYGECKKCRTTLNNNE